MILFDGALTGEAKKHYIKRTLNVGSIIIAVTTFLVTIILILISFPSVATIRKNFFVIISVLILNAVSPFIFRLLITKKDRERINLNRVTIEDGKIKAISGHEPISQKVSQVKVVYDCGEYYDIRFVSKYCSPVFICQKDLISKGTIEEFESIFSGKIIHK